MVYNALRKRTLAAEWKDDVSHIRQGKIIEERIRLRFVDHQVDCRERRLYFGNYAQLPVRVANVHPLIGKMRVEFALEPIFEAEGSVKKYWCHLNLKL